MYAIKIAFPFLLFIVTSSTIHGMQVSLYCYDKPYCQGVRVRFENDNLIVPDLAQHPYYFDNRIQSCVFNGMFILYDGIYYNENNLGVSIIAIVIRRYQRLFEHDLSTCLLACIIFNFTLGRGLC